MESLDVLRSVQGHGDPRLRATLFEILRVTERPQHVTDLAEVVPGSRHSVSKILSEAAEENRLTRKDGGYMFTNEGEQRYGSILMQVRDAYARYLDETPTLGTLTSAIKIRAGEPDLDIGGPEDIAQTMMMLVGLDVGRVGIQTDIDATPEVAASLIEAMDTTDDCLGPAALRYTHLDALYNTFDAHTRVRVEFGDGYEQIDPAIIRIPEHVVQTAVALGDIELEGAAPQGKTYILTTGVRGTEPMEPSDESPLQF